MSTLDTAIDLDYLVQPDRVHRSVYTDPKIFDLEMTQIFEKIWVYCGHESQVPKVGDYYTMQIGRQPMVMVRDQDMTVRVLYNRCPHRGVQLCGNQSGNTGKHFGTLRDLTTQPFFHRQKRLSDFTHFSRTLGFKIRKITPFTKSIGGNCETP